MNGDILSNRLSKDTSATSFYPTPADVTESLLQFLQLPKETMIWEPACGAGNMVEVFRRYGHKVIATDLHNYGSLCDGSKYQSGVDFLQQKECSADWIITNPPFHLASEFIQHCFTLGKPFALLFKSQFWHAQKRARLFEIRKPEYVLPLTWRPDFLFGSKNGSPTMEVAWTVWGKKSSLFTYYQLLRRPEMQDIPGREL